jgi:hypothetical protein
MWSGLNKAGQPAYPALLLAWQLEEKKGIVVEIY